MYSPRVSIIKKKKICKRKIKTDNVSTIVPMTSFVWISPTSAIKSAPFGLRRNGGTVGQGRCCCKNIEIQRSSSKATTTWPLAPDTIIVLVSWWKIASSPGLKKPLLVQNPVKLIAPKIRVKKKGSYKSQLLYTWITFRLPYLITSPPLLGYLTWNSVGPRIQSSVMAMWPMGSPAILSIISFP